MTGMAASTTIPLLLLILVAYSDGYPKVIRFFIDIEAYKEQCYGSFIEKNVTEVQVDFQQVKMEKIEFVVTTGGRQLFSKKTASSFWLETNPNYDSYEFCIRNDRWETSRVELSIWHMTPVDLVDEIKMQDISTEDFRKLRDLSIPIYDLNKRIDVIHQKLNQVREIQMVFQDKEAMDLELMQENGASVFFWGAFAVSYMVLVTIGRSFLIRKLFDEDSRIGKLLRKGKLD